MLTMSSRKRDRHDTGRRTKDLDSVLGIALLLSCAFILHGCGEDTTEVHGPADVNSYVGGLPAWDEAVPFLPMEEDTTTVLPPEIDWTAQRVCSTTQCSVQNSPEKVITFDPDSEILYLGSLIQGKTYAQGLGSMLELPIRERAPLTISVNLLTTETSKVVHNPSLSTVHQAIAELITQAEASGLEPRNDFDFKTMEMFSLKQGMLSMGVSYKHLAGSVALNLDISHSAQTHTIASYLVQKMFTTSIELPTRPSDVFSDDFTPDLLQERIDLGQIGPDNLPVYVSNIVWGRIAMVTMTSQASVFDMRTALEASYGALEGSLEQQYKDILNTCEIHVMSIGGGGVEVGSLVDEIKNGGLGTFFDTDLPLTTAAPISYTLRNLAGNPINTIAYVGDMTSYNITTCNTVGATRYTDQSEWTLAVQGLCAGTTTEIFYTTNDNMELAHNETGASIVLLAGRNTPLGHLVTWPSGNTGYPFDFFLESMDVGVPEWNMGALVYEDMESGSLQMGNDWISIGDVDDWEYDDFRVGVVPLEGTDVYAIGFQFGDNRGGDDETWNAYGADHHLVNTMAGLTTGQGGSSFLGYVSTVPLTCVEYDEGDDDDDVFVKNFYFGYRTRP